MAVLEITLLRLKEGTSPSDPSLLTNLRTIRDQLKTNSRFYVDTKDTSNLFIFGLWPTLDAHHAFLASPERDAILGPQEGQTAFVWGLHVGDVECMEDLPLDAPIMYLHRFESALEGQTTLDGAVGLTVEELKGKSRDMNFPPLFRVRLDAAAGKKERILLHGVEEGFAIFTQTELGDFHDATYTREQWQLRDLERM